MVRGSFWQRAVLVFPPDEVVLALNDRNEWEVPARRIEIIGAVNSNAKLVCVEWSLLAEP
ncbi:hypothetical protein CUU95_14220 [Vreelandella alkaliphila]|nr:hypothetical protein CUU95_14220 [Halomonas alkaliphila]